MELRVRGEGRLPVVDVVEQEWPATRSDPNPRPWFWIRLEGVDLHHVTSREGAEAYAKRVRRALRGFRKKVRG